MTSLPTANLTHLPCHNLLYIMTIHNCNNLQANTEKSIVGVKYYSQSVVSVTISVNKAKKTSSVVPNLS